MAACGDSTAPPPPSVPTSVAVTPSSLDFESFTDTAQLTATVRDQQGAALGGVTVTWESSAPDVATVSPSGLVTSVGNGSATVTARAGAATGSAAVSVEQVARSLAFLSAADSLMVGDSIRMSAEALDGAGVVVTEAALEWTSSDPSIVRVTVDGWVFARIPGIVEITVALGDLAASTSLVSLPLPPPWRSRHSTIHQRGPLARQHQLADRRSSVRVAWVELDDDGRVAHLVLAGNGLIGAIPPEIGSLVDLISLHLGLNDLSGPIPAEIKALRQLASLGLTYGGVTGVIPRKSVNSKAWCGWGCSETTSRDRSRRKSATREPQTPRPLLQPAHRPIPPQIGNLAGLEYLALCGIDSNPEQSNRLTGTIPPEIGNLTRLRHLNLGANLLSGPIPPEIGNLTSLDSLGLYSNMLTGIPAEIGNLDGLLFLSAYGNRLTGPIPAEIGNLVNLETLNLGIG